MHNKGMLRTIDLDQQCKCLLKSYHDQVQTSIHVAEWAWQEEDKRYGKYYKGFITRLEYVEKDDAIA